MPSMGFTITAAALVVTCSMIHIATAFSKAPQFTLNLDLPPAERWGGAIETILSNFSWEYSFGPLLEMYAPAFALLPNNTGPLLLAQIKSQYPDSYEEIQGGIAAFRRLGYNQSLTIEQAALFFYFYELGHINALTSVFPRKACCGILSLPSNMTENMIHGRNMDESPHEARNLTLDITVVKGGKTLYRVYDWTWVSTGFYTASKSNTITLEMNWRDTGTRTYQDIMGRILDNNTVPSAIMFRHIMENDITYDEAVRYLNTSQFGAPFYTITSGPYRRGAVLSIAWNPYKNVVETLDDSSKDWFMVQTNYDRWKPDPPSDPRRTVAQDALMTVGRYRGGTKFGVFMALSTYPVHNPQTFFTVLMSVGEDLEGYKRVAMLLDPSG